MNEIWLVDDDKNILNALDNILKKNGYLVSTFKKPEELLDKLKEETPAVIIADIFFVNSSLTGEDIVIKIKNEFPIIQTIIMSGESDIKKTLNCLKLGALDFLEKPVSLPRLLTSLKNAETIYNAKKATEEEFSILGSSSSIKKCIDKLRKLAQLNESVLIYGESGTGKELAARNLHLFSNRYSKPLSIINCTALNSNLIESELFGHKKGSFTGAINDKKGFFEIANKSSLFIDEIGDFPMELQAKLLRVIQEKKVTPVGDNKDIDIDTRLIFATHQNLENLITNKKFREDFYFRISTFTITLPPLRERLKDVDDIATHFLENFLKENNLTHKHFSSSALDKLKTYNYPGNIRELAQIVKNAAFFSLSEKITPEDISFNGVNSSRNIWDITKKMTLKEGKIFFEKELINKRLQANNNNIEVAAESLGMVKNNLYRKLNTHGINYQK